MSVSIQIKLNEKLYLRDPLQSDLGRKIISEGIILIEKLGFEDFTFKKLGVEIGSPEASVYRYFENKHNLLVYLISWYWAWLEFMVEYRTTNLSDPREKLKKVLHVLAQSGINDTSTFIDESLLHKIVIAESSKVYLTKNVDQENKEGFFSNYKSLCKKISSIILEINPSFPFPRALTSTIIEAAHNQIFFGEHLPSLTDFKTSGNNFSELERFLETVLFNTIKNQ
jgi:AcrR family transcriptional regulator